MASGGLELLISARDGVTSVLGGVKEKINAFGSAIANGFQKGLDIMSKAKYLFGDVIKSALSAYAQQEAAERSLIAAHNAFGEAGAELIESEKRLAAAIQDETGVGDENTLKRMASLKMLGVQTSQLGAAARGMVALTGAGMSEAAAERALAQAYTGNYGALERYIPALRQAETETEKQEALNDFLTRGYEQQQARLDTVQGSWGALKGRLGDAAEGLGAVINSSGETTQVIQWLSDKVKQASQIMTDWVANGGLAKVRGYMLGFGEMVRHAFNSTIAHIEKWYHQTVYFIKLPFTDTKQFVLNLVDLIKSYYTYLWDWVKWIWGKIKGQTIEPPDTSKLKAAMAELYESDRYQSEESIRAREKMHAAVEAVNAKIEAEAERHQDRMVDIVDDMEARIQEEQRKTAEAQTQAAENMVLINDEAFEAADALDRAATSMERLGKNTERVDLSKLERDAKAAADELLKAENAFNGMTYGKATADYHQSLRDARDKRAQERRNANWEKQMQALEKRVADGGVLSKKDEFRLKQYQELRKKREEAAAKAAAAQAVAQANGAAGAAAGAAAAGAAAGAAAAQPQAAAPWATENTLQSVLNYLKRNLEAAE